MDVSSPSSSRKRGYPFQEEEEEWLTLKLSLLPSPPLSLSSAPPLLPQLVSAPPPPFQFVSLAEPMISAFLSSAPQETNFLGPPPCPFPSYEPAELELLPRCEYPSQEVQEASFSSSRQGRPRRLPVRATKKDKSDTITPPFPWATSNRATVYSLQHLLTRGIRTISGTVQCKKCEQQHDIEFDLQEKFYQVAQYIAENKYDMHDRALTPWTNPELPNCEKCGQQNSLKPVITKKRTINWLFLLLGQMLGCCKLEHLKYFCKHTKNHRTGAKDRLLYLTYFGLCKQLDPEGQYDVNNIDNCS